MMKKENDSLNTIRQRIVSTGLPVAIFSHPAPDGDGIGSTVGLWYLLKALGCSVEAVIPRPLPDRYDFMLDGVDCFTPPVDVKGKIAVVLDSSDEQRLAAIGQDVCQASLVINIDHHRGNTRFGHLNHVDISASAVGELILELYGGDPVPPQAAQALFTAIFTDTGRFSFANTSARALTAAARLVDMGAMPSVSHANVYQNRDINYYRFLAVALGKLQVLYNGKAALLVLERSLLDKYGIPDWDLEGLTDYPRSLAGVEIAATVREQADGTVKVSLRSRGKRDVAAIARNLGGGGHLNASGVHVDWPTSQLLEKLTQAIDRELSRNG